MNHDLRKYTRQTNFRLFVGFVLVLFLVGDGLIFLIYGPASALMGLVCLAAGLAPIGLIWMIFIILDLVVKRFGDQ